MQLLFESFQLPLNEVDSVDDELCGATDHSVEKECVINNSLLIHFTWTYLDVPDINPFSISSRY